MVKLNPLDQARFFEAEPEVFIPLQGTWGRRGATQVCLKAAKKESVRRALAAAWRNTALKRLTAQIDSLD